MSSLKVPSNATAHKSIPQTCILIHSFDKQNFFLSLFLFFANSQFFLHFFQVDQSGSNLSLNFLYAYPHPPQILSLRIGLKVSPCFLLFAISPYRLPSTHPANTEPLLTFTQSHKHIDFSNYLFTPRLHTFPAAWRAVLALRRSVGLSLFQSLITVQPVD